jgi:molybdopterin-guanine dinucleotide biosynthesis protein A
MTSEAAEALRAEVTAQAWAFIAVDCPDLPPDLPDEVADWIEAGIQFGMAAAMLVLHERGDLEGIQP